MVEPRTWWYYITPEGAEVLLNNHEDTFFLEEEGCGIEDAEPIGNRVSFEHGQIVTGLYLQPRTILLRIGIVANNDLNWRRFDNDYCRQLSPFINATQVGTLRRVYQDGVKRDIGAWLIGYSKASIDRDGPVYGERVLKFWCPDPFFYDPTKVQYNYNLTPVGGFEYPFVYPFTFAETNINSHNDVYNEGDVKAWPSVYIYGPLRNPAVNNDTTNETFAISKTLDSGDYINIDMLNCVIVFYDASEATSTDITYALSTASVFWALKRGNNDVHITAMDVEGGGVIFEYNTRYQCT